MSSRQLLRRLGGVAVTLLVASLVVYLSVYLSPGSPEQVLTEDLLREVYAVRGSVITHPETGRPHVLLTPSVAQSN